MILPCFYIALILMAVAVFISYKNIKKLTKALGIMMIGVFLTITTLMYPIYFDVYNEITSGIFAILYSLRALIGFQNVETAYRVHIAGWLFYGYYTFLYISFIAAPIFTVGFLISLFSNFFDRVRFRFLSGNRICVFSHLNENSITICENHNSLNTQIVFCNTKFSIFKDTELFKRARELGAIMLEKSEVDIQVDKKHIHFCQISSNKDYNINTTIALIEKYREKTKSDIKITSFTDGITTELLLDSIDKGRIRINLLGEVKYACYNLLDQVPLFDGIKNKKISAIIIGCGCTGMEMLKAITWCGQISGCELEIKIIDKHASEREKQFILQCPDISLDKYNIRFIDADVKNVDFENALIRYCSDATYIVVSTGDDKLNIDTAVYLRKHFLRQDRQHFNNKPKINLRVRDLLKNKHIDALCDANIEDYGLFAFGSLVKTFSIKDHQRISLENLAIGVHLAYSSALNGTEEQFTEAMKNYYLKEYNQRSSFASALHIKYKFFSCGITGLSGERILAKQIDEFEERLRDPDVLEQLAALEHERWNVFMRTEGFTAAEVKAVKVYHRSGNEPSYIHYLAKLHPAIVDWSELGQISNEVSEIMNKTYDFKQDDNDIVRRIPDILRAQEYIRNVDFL